MTFRGPPSVKLAFLLFINFVLFGAGLPMQGSTRTPDRTASAGNQRRHTTPSLSTQAWEESRGAPRQRVEDSDSAATPASIAFEHFGFLGWTWRDKHMGSKLPLCLFLTLHDRGNEHKIGNGDAVLRWVREWLSTSPYSDVVTLDCTSHQEDHRDIFGLDDDIAMKKGKDTFYTIPSYHWGSWTKTTKPWGADWGLTGSDADGFTFFTSARGAHVEVCLGPTKLTGVGPITSITFNGHCVRNHAALRRFTSIRAEDDLPHLLNVVWHTVPCQGVSQQHIMEDAKMPAGAADLFPSLVRQAQRTLEKDPSMPFDGRGRWNSAFVE
ncbi:unnamed protein product, partial [Pylaiella littoralis]